MDGGIFRRDRFLRSSAYHLATWSLAGFLLELQLLNTPPENAATGWSIAAVVVAGSLMTSFTHERRVGKIAGVAGESRFPGAGRLWTAVLGALIALTLLLLAQGRPGLVYDVWAVGVGIGFAIWGMKAEFFWYSQLGVALVLAALADLMLLEKGGPAEPLRLFVLGLALPAAALWTNRRWLWFRD